MNESNCINTNKQANKQTNKQTNKQYAIYIYILINKQVRFIVVNESGYELKFYVYREVVEESTGKCHFVSMDKRNPGPYHMREITQPYENKTNLQRKRFVAQSNNTTYALDYPELFQQVYMH